MVSAPFLSLSICFYNRIMMDFFRRNVFAFLSGFLFLLFSACSFLSDGYFGGADNITHFQLSHYAFYHPSLFLNAWGRPLYTIIAAPFAQFGLPGAKLLNILLGIATATLAGEIARKLEIKPTWVAILFVCFTPLYFVMLPTVLTEILFSFILLLSIYLFLSEKYRLSAIVISFLPFARTEGFVLLPLFFLTYLIVKQGKVIPFLLTGTLFFSVIGGLYFRDFFWVFTQFPYPVTYHHPIYKERGDLFHFIQDRNLILGLPLEILFIAGFLQLFREWFSGSAMLRKQSLLIFLLLLLPFFTYLAFHSILYWKALGGSMGLDRVLTAVLPLAALIALKGFQGIIQVFKTNCFLRSFFTILILIWVVIFPFRIYPYPYPLSPEEETIKAAVAWFKTSPYNKKTVYYTDNNVPYYLGIDPYQKSPAVCHLFGDAKYLDTIPEGSILVWDAHFGANESKIPLDSLLGNDRQQVIGYFRPLQPWITFGGHNYDCYITKTKPAEKLADNWAIRDSILDVLDEKECLKTLYLNNFENPWDGSNPSFYSGDTAHSGKLSFRMDGRTEYSPGVCKEVKGLPVTSKPAMIQATVYCYLPEIEIKSITLLVISFEQNGKSYSYTAMRLNDKKVRPARWNRFSISDTIPVFKSSRDLLKVYIWNPGKQIFYLDDLKANLTYQPL